MWHKGTLPSAEILSRIQSETGYSIDWLLTGKGVEKLVNKHFINTVTNKNIVYIPYYTCFKDYYLAASSQKYDDQHYDVFAFHKSWFDEKLDVTTDNLFVFKVDDDSMEPTLLRNNIVLASSTESFKDYSEDGLYLIKINDVLKVKRLQHLPGNKFKIISDNPTYETYTTKLDSLSNEITLVGYIHFWINKISNK